MIANVDLLSTRMYIWLCIWLAACVNSHAHEHVQTHKKPGKNQLEDREVCQSGLEEGIISRVVPDHSIEWDAL